MLGPGRHHGECHAVARDAPDGDDTVPVVAPWGPARRYSVAAHDVGVARVPLKRTVLVPCVVPKFAPLIVTVVPTLPSSATGS